MCFSSSLVKYPQRSSAIFMYVTECMIKFLPLSFKSKVQSFYTSTYSIIKFLPLFAKCTIHRVYNDYYACKILTRVQTVLLVQFHHINDREGRGVCVPDVLKFYWSNLMQ